MVRPSQKHHGLCPPTLGRRNSSGITTQLTGSIRSTAHIHALRRAAAQSTRRATRVPHNPRCHGPRHAAPQHAADQATRSSPCTSHVHICPKTQQSNTIEALGFNLEWQLLDHRWAETNCSSCYQCLYWTWLTVLGCSWCNTHHVSSLVNHCCPTPLPSSSSDAELADQGARPKAPCQPKG